MQLVSAESSVTRAEELLWLRLSGPACWLVLAVLMSPFIALDLCFVIAGPGHPHPAREFAACICWILENQAITLAYLATGFSQAGIEWKP
ncbi:MAG: hypothetical protein ACK5PS_12545 [Desulfopila sp.]